MGDIQEKEIGQRYLVKWLIIHQKIIQQIGMVK